MQFKAGISLRLAGVEIEQIPLRHHRNIGRLDRQVPEINYLHLATGNMNGRLIYPAMRQSEQLIKQAKLMEKFQRGRMHRIAPEIPKEIVMLLKHGHTQAGPREQQSCHHPCRAAADNQNVAFIVLH